MRKPKILAVCREKNLFILVVKKSKCSFDTVMGFLVRVGFPKHEVNKILGLMGGPDDNYSFNKYDNVLYEDVFFKINSRTGSATIIFGNSKIFVCLFEKNKTQIVKNLDEFFTLSSPNI